MTNFDHYSSHMCVYNYMLSSLFLPHLMEMGRIHPQNFMDRSHSSSFPAECLTWTCHRQRIWRCSQFTLVMAQLSESVVCWDPQQLSTLSTVTSLICRLSQPLIITGEVCRPIIPLVPLSYTHCNLCCVSQNPNTKQKTSITFFKTKPCSLLFHQSAHRYDKQTINSNSFIIFLGLTRPHYIFKCTELIRIIRRRIISWGCGFKVHTVQRGVALHWNNNRIRITQ